MTHDQLKAKFPHCSESFVKANSSPPPIASETRLRDRSGAGSVGGIQSTHSPKQNASQRILARNRPSTDEEKLNKTEKAYLAHLRVSGYDWIGIQCITLKLGDDCRYTPDFWTQRNGQLDAHEVKGFWRDDAKVKIKVAARSYRNLARFAVAQKIKNGWRITEVKP